EDGPLWRPRRGVGRWRCQAGNHGGASDDERAATAMFASPRWHRAGHDGEPRAPGRWRQTDVATTLALLLGVPVPALSIGAPIAPVIEAAFPMAETRLRTLRRS